MSRKIRDDLRAGKMTFIGYWDDHGKHMAWITADETVYNISTMPGKYIDPYEDIHSALPIAQVHALRELTANSKYKEWKAGNAIRNYFSTVAKWVRWL